MAKQGQQLSKVIHMHPPVALIEQAINGELAALPDIKEGLTKSQIAQLADTSVERVLEKGNVFPVAEALAAMEEFVKTVRKDDRFIDFMREELEKQSAGKLTTKAGSKIELCEAGVKYDYAANADWRVLDEQIKYLVEKRKQLEERLRKISPGKIAVDEETGEVIEGVNKISKSTYKITLAK